MNDVEKLVAFNNVRSYLSQDDQKELLTKLAIDENNLTHRLRGLNVETEFFVIIHLLDSCKDILSFDEGTSVLTQSYSPDACLVLKSNEKIFVEIKSKEEFQYKISGGNLQKRIDFANEFGFKLYFAVKLKSFWGLYSSDYLQSKSGKLTFPDDYNNSDFETVFGSKLIVMPKGIKVESYYSTTQDSLVGIQNPNFGNLFKYKFFFDEKLIFEVVKANESEAIKSIILESLHDEMSKQYQDIKDLGNGETLITEMLTDNTFFYDYNFLLAHIYHTQSDLGYMLDTTSFYKSIIEQKGKTPITKEFLFTVLGLLQKDGVPIIISTLRDQKK
jgi:Holliday junction resolvase